MYRCICKSKSTLYRPLLSVCVLLGLSACASDAALQDRERARYDNLESELLSEQEAKDRRLRAEYRVNQQLEKLEADKLAAELASNNATDTNPAEEVNETDSLDSDNATIQSASSNPVVTQIVVGQPADGASIEGWNQQKYPNPEDGTPICAVVSIPVSIRNGSLDTQVSVIVAKSAVFLRTDAAFDTEVLETGYQIDSGLPIAFDRYLNELTAVVDDNHAQLLSAMKTGTTLSVAFAYDPQLASADTHVVELGLDSFGQAWLDARQCSD